MERDGGLTTGECARRDIVCPRDVPDVDSHWFANREPQAPGAMSKQERLPFYVTMGKWAWAWGGGGDI